MYHFCHFVDLPRAAVRILSNMTFLFVSLSYTAESAIVTAFITFIPKFIESQFGIPASNASIYTGKVLPQGSLKRGHCVHRRKRVSGEEGQAHTKCSPSVLPAPGASGFVRKARGVLPKIPIIFMRYVY